MGPTSDRSLSRNKGCVARARHLPPGEGLPQNPGGGGSHSDPLGKNPDAPPPRAGDGSLPSLRPRPAGSGCPVPGADTVLRQRRWETTTAFLPQTPPNHLIIRPLMHSCPYFYFAKTPNLHFLRAVFSQVIYPETSLILMAPGSSRK